MLRGALAALLTIESDIEVLGSFSDGEQALRAVGKHRPEVLVTDREMPKRSGLELTARVKELYPDTRVLILTTFARPGYLRRALEAGTRLSSQGPALGRTGRRGPESQPRGTYRGSPASLGDMERGERSAHR